MSLDVHWHSIMKMSKEAARAQSPVLKSNMNLDLLGSVV